MMEYIQPIRVKEYWRQTVPTGQGWTVGFNFQDQHYLTTMLRFRDYNLVHRLAIHKKWEHDQCTFPALHVVVTTHPNEDNRRQVAKLPAFEICDYYMIQGLML